MKWYRYQDDLLILELHVHPGSKFNKINGLHGDRLRIRIQSPPVDGGANKHLLGFLAKAFGVAKSNVRIISGERGRDKTVAVQAPRKQPDWFHQMANDSLEMKR